MALRRGARPELLPSKDASARLRDGDANLGVQKFSPIELVEKDAAGLQKVAFIISDESKDRYGDIVAADGWDFQNFSANPVLLWAHDYSLPPVGRMGTPWKTVGKKVKAVVEEFTPRDLNPMGAAVEGMIRQGFLNTVSVGFQPIEFSFNDDYSINYQKQELLEVSVVPVPANPNALVAAKGAGLWVPQLDEWVTKQLDLKTGGLIGVFAREAHQALRGPQVQVPADLVADEEPLAEVLELKAALEENTAAVRELVDELRAERAERAAVSAEQRAVRVAERAAKHVSSLLSPTVK